MLFKYKEIAPIPLCCDDSAHYAALHKKTPDRCIFLLQHSRIHRTSAQPARRAVLEHSADGSPMQENPQNPHKHRTCLILIRSGRKANHNMLYQ